MRGRLAASDLLRKGRNRLIVRALPKRPGATNLTKLLMHPAFRPCDPRACLGRAF